MNNIIELLNQMKDFEYGWIDKNGLRYVNKIVMNKFTTDYYLQNPKDLDKTKIGICWDQVEYERLFFEENKIKYKTYFILYTKDQKNFIHTFLIFNLNNKYYWFENTYKNNTGIFEYSSLDDCLKNVQEAFINENKIDDVKREIIMFYEYDKPSYGINANSFITHCISSKKCKKGFNN